MTVTDIIDELGGPTAISAVLGLPPTTVANWKARGSIPARYHAELLRIGDGRVTPLDIITAHATGGA